MASGFQAHIEILPPPQRRLWDELSSIPPEFILYGGTALALHLGHRESVDFGFFGTRAIDPSRLTTEIGILADATVTQVAPNTLGCTLDRGGPVRLSFFGLPDFPHVQPPLISPDNGLQIASLLDIAGTKASVVQMRAEAKDYLDIHALLADGRVDLPMALSAARAIYGRSFNPQVTLKALSYFEDGNLSRLPQSVKDRLVDAACKVDLDRLPSLAL